MSYYIISVSRVNPEEISLHFTVMCAILSAARHTNIRRITMKCPHIWRKYFEQTGWDAGGERTFCKIKVCVICGKRKYVGEVK